MESSITRNYKLLIYLAPLINSIVGMSIDLYAPSLPAIAHAFHVDSYYIKLTISITLFGFSIGQLFFGTLVDKYGRKNVLMYGLICFSTVSILAPLSSSLLGLIAVRFLQGFLTASASISSKAFLIDTYKGNRLAIASSYLSIAWGMGPIIAPFIGGYLQYYFNWKSIFYFYSIYTMIICVIIAFFIKETHKPIIEKDNSFNLVRGFGEIIEDKVFIIGTIILGLNYSIFISFNIFGPFLIQNIMGNSSIVFGRLALLIGFSYFIGSLFNSFLIRQFKLQRVIYAGLFGMLIFCIFLFLLSIVNYITIVTIVIPFLGLSFSIGLITPNIMAKCMSAFPKKAGKSTAILGFMLLLCSGIFTLFLSFFKSTTLHIIAIILLIFSILQLLLLYFLNSRSTLEINSLKGEKDAPS